MVVPQPIRDTLDQIRGSGVEIAYGIGGTSPAFGPEFEFPRQVRFAWVTKFRNMDMVFRLEALSDYGRETLAKLRHARHVTSQRLF